MTLDRLTRDLTADARAGLLEPVRCRDDEISRVVDILLRHGKNNPALVGPSGVGKTAIAEGLAQRIATGAVPVVLRHARVLALDHVSMLAGTMYRGQYEERLRGVVAQASADPDIILFIDELHNLIGQGSAMGAAMDAANMLKPALVRGEFRVVGATTEEEYERWVCGDPALERRFQKVPVRELSADQTMIILEARKERLERHHNVAISADALRASVQLTDIFISDRARPDRAIDALDEACAHAQALAAYSPETEALILERRELLRRAAAGPAIVGGETTGSPAGDQTAVVEDPVEKWAREGIAAIERFGAEIEAAFAPAGRPDRSEQPTPAPVTRSAETPSGSARLAVVETEVERRLVAEGIVVRGHDVARVVGLATGKRVEWAT
ncbi:MAG: AAA family ATPase [Gemmatimonadaceae bacterium]